MSKVVKTVKKGFKKVKKFVKKNWKPIVAVGLAAFTGGLSIGGLGAFKSAVAANGLWSTVGSTMWAGATGIAGTLGIGSGAAGTFAAHAGMQGATLLTGAAAQGLGMAAQTMGPAANAASSAVGTYTGPGSSLMGGGGSLFGGGSTVGTGQVAPYMNAAGQGTGRALGAGQSLAGQAGGGGFLRSMATAAAPALVTAAGGYFAAKGEEDAMKGDYYGVSHEDPTQVYRQNFDSPYAGYFTPDGQHAGFDPRRYQLSDQGGLMDLPGHMRYTGAV